LALLFFGFSNSELGTATILSSSRRPQPGHISIVVCRMRRITVLQQTGK